VQAINARCMKCGYRLAWVLLLGKRPTSQSKSAGINKHDC
jgi:C4-type Zn-finger protein